MVGREIGPHRDRHVALGGVEHQRVFGFCHSHYSLHGFLEMDVSIGCDDATNAAMSFHDGRLLDVVELGKGFVQIGVALVTAIRP